MKDDNSIWAENKNNKMKNKAGLEISVSQIFVSPFVWEFSEGKSGPARFSSGEFPSEMHVEIFSVLNGINSIFAYVGS